MLTAGIDCAAKNTKAGTFEDLEISLLRRQRLEPEYGWEIAF